MTTDEPGSPQAAEQQPGLTREQLKAMEDPDPDLTPEEATLLARAAASPTVRRSRPRRPDGSPPDPIPEHAGRIGRDSDGDWRAEIPDVGHVVGQSLLAVWAGGNALSAATRPGRVRWTADEPSIAEGIAALERVEAAGTLPPRRSGSPYLRTLPKPVHEQDD